MQRFETFLWENYSFSKNQVQRVLQGEINGRYTLNPKNILLQKDILLRVFCVTQL